MLTKNKEMKIDKRTLFGKWVKYWFYKHENGIYSRKLSDLQMRDMFTVEELKIEYDENIEDY